MARGTGCQLTPRQGSLGEALEAFRRDLQYHSRYEGRETLRRWKSMRTENKLAILRQTLVFFLNSRCMPRIRLWITFHEPSRTCCEHTCIAYGKSRSSAMYPVLSATLRSPQDARVLPDAWASHLLTLYKVHSLPMLILGWDLEKARKE